MKKYIIPILLALFTFLSCDKMPANGDLDGMWKIMEIEHDGTVRNTEDEHLYMSIQLGLFELYTPPMHSVFGYFDHKDNTIRFYQFSHNSSNESESDDNYPYSESEISWLSQWGHYSLDETFNIEKLTRNELILKSDSTRIKYIKF